MAKSKPVNAGGFTVVASLEDSAGNPAAKVAGVHHQTQYCIDVSSVYYQTCTVDLIAARGINANCVELAEATTPGAPWSRSPLVTLGPSGPGKPPSTDRRASSVCRAANCTANSEVMEAKIDFTVASPTRITSYLKLPL